MNIDNKIKNIIFKMLCYNLEGNQDTSEYDINMQDLGLDSIQMIELILELEKEFEITLNEEDMKPELLNSYEGISSLVSMKCGSN